MPIIIVEHDLLLKLMIIEGICLLLDLLLASIVIYNVVWVIFVLRRTFLVILDSIAASIHLKLLAVFLLVLRLLFLATEGVVTAATRS